MMVRRRARHGPAQHVSQLPPSCPAKVGSPREAAMWDRPCPGRSSLCVMRTRSGHLLAVCSCREASDRPMPRSPEAHVREAWNGRRLSVRTSDGGILRRRRQCGWLLGLLSSVSTAMAIPVVRCLRWTWCRDRRFLCGSRRTVICHRRGTILPVSTEATNWLLVRIDQDRVFVGAALWIHEWDFGYARAFEDSSGRHHSMVEGTQAAFFVRTDSRR